LLRKVDASDRAVLTIGAPNASVLQVIWHVAILKLGGVPLFLQDVYPLKGGNQLMTDRFALKLGDRVRLNSPLTGIEHGDKGVRVSYPEYAQEKKMDGDYLVRCM
jgi:monoamine oxidase